VSEPIALTDEVRDIMQRIARAKEHVRGWKDNIKRWRKLYDMKHYNNPGKANEIQFNDPTYTNTVDLAIGIMLANRLRWHAFGFTPSRAEQQETGHIEKLLDGTLAVNNEREEANQLYQLYLHFVRDGGAAIYSVFDPEIADEQRFQKEIPDETEGARPVWAFKEIPLRVQVIDPESMIALPGGPKRWLMLGRIENRSVLDIETIYGVRIGKFGSYSDEQKATTMGEFIDVWDYVMKPKPIKNSEGAEVYNEVLGKVETAPKLVVRNTVLFEGQPLFGPREMEGYKELAYTLQFFKPTDKSPEHWHSIISPLEGSVAMLERTFNRRAHQIDVYTSLPIVSKTQPGRAVKIDPGLYNHVNITPDESIEFPTWQGNAPDLNFQIEFLRSRIQQSGFSDVMFGSGTSQVAGYALSQLGDQNRIRLEQPVTHLELLLTHWAKKAMSLLLEFAPGAQVCVYGQHRGKDYLEYVEVDDLSKYAVRAEIIPEFPNEETRKTAMATQVKGTLSNYTIMERYLGIEQPEDEQDRMFIEMASNHPITVQYMIMAELTERAEAGDAVATQVLQQMQAGMIPGAQPGRPKDPNSPEQLTGTQSPTGQPVPQALGQSPDKSESETLANAAPNMSGGIE
jgi:hypothetical protein